jgi:plastocyanin
MNNGYRKRPLWQWILIYVVIAAVVYGLIYYFVLAKKGGYPNSQSTQSANPQATLLNSAPSTQNTVQISNYSFSPARLTVKVGGTVTWTNQDSMSHSATADDNSFDTGLLGQGKSGTATFNKAGTYTYHCSVHPYMHGTIIVQ